MRWWPRKRRRVSPAVVDADRRLAEARARLASTRQSDDDVTEVVEQLRDLRRRNHFGLMIAEALKGQPQ